jgi:putative transposase
MGSRTSNGRRTMPLDATSHFHVSMGSSLRATVDMPTADDGLSQPRYLDPGIEGDAGCPSSRALAVGRTIDRLDPHALHQRFYLKAYNTVSEARASIGCYFGFYNTRRPHSSLDRQTPDQAYFNWLPQIAAA